MSSPDSPCSDYTQESLYLPVSTIILLVIGSIFGKCFIKNVFLSQTVRMEVMQSWTLLSSPIVKSCIDVICCGGYLTPRPVSSQQFLLERLTVLVGRGEQGCLQGG